MIYFQFLKKYQNQILTFFLLHSELAVYYTGTYLPNYSQLVYKSLSGGRKRKQIVIILRRVWCCVHIFKCHGSWKAPRGVRCNKSSSITHVPGYKVRCFNQRGSCNKPQDPINSPVRRPRNSKQNGFIKEPPFLYESILYSALLW